jgi:glycosyltransferase involved in cell wall biosynthesis
VADRVALLRAEGHAVEVIAGGPAADPLVSFDGGVSVTRLPAQAGDGPDLFAGAGAPEALERGGAEVFLGALRFTAGLAAAVAARAHRWDRLESHWLAPCALAGLAAAPRLPHRAHAHSGDVSLLERMPFGASLARTLADSPADLVFVSETLRARFAQLAGRARGTVEPPPVPAALFSPRSRPDPAARAALGFASPTVISVGRLVPVKGYDLLVRACASGGVGEGPIDVAILGDGPERERLASLARRLEVPLRLPGFRPRYEVARWLRAADVYAQPSRVLGNGRSEGLPVATREALAVGVPVVAAASGGLAELAVREPRVKVVAAGDAGALRTALRHALGVSNVARV